MKKENKPHVDLEGKKMFIWLSAIVWTCLSGIIFKLILGRTDWMEYTAVVIFASLLGSFYGVALNAEDAPKDKKVELFNPFKKARWAKLLVASSVIVIIAVFYACVICDAEWKMVIILAFTVTWLTCEISYALYGIW